MGHSGIPHTKAATQSDIVTSLHNQTSRRDGSFVVVAWSFLIWKKVNCKLSCLLTVFLCVCVCMCVYLHKYIPLLCISIHTSSPPVHNSIIPPIMLHPQKWYLPFSSQSVTLPPEFPYTRTRAPTRAQTGRQPACWWMCTTAACVQWNSTVYTYHIHLISPNEISTDLLFTMHRWAAAARHRATAHIHTYTQALRPTHTHARTPTAPPSVSESQCQQERGRSSLFSWCWKHSALRSQTDPWGLIW